MDSEFTILSDEDYAESSEFLEAAPATLLRR